MKLIDAERKFHFAPYTTDSEEFKIEMTAEEILNKYTDEGCPEAYAPSRDGTEWIPVSERLPSEKGEYLVTYRLVLYGDVLDSEDKVGFDTFRGKTSWAKKENRRVIAWKPKPKPYYNKFENIELYS